MPANRLEALRNLLLRNPADAFARYGLAMEYANSGDFPKAVEEFRAVLAQDPKYHYAYFHGGQALEKLGRLEEAGEMYVAGIAVASQSGDTKALAEFARRARHSAALKRKGRRLQAPRVFSGGMSLEQSDPVRRELCTFRAHP